MAENAEQHSQYDVIVVGFGVAGAAAAIEAADRGARVLVLDRSYGGGASALSGGVVYAGGGTAFQTAAGYDDNPENLYAYLRQEVGDAVDDATLRRFCEQSPAMIPWLEEQGATFGSAVAPYKTSYPTDKHYLYFSGNEKAYPYRNSAMPAPRGHRVVAKGLASGKVLWKRLAESALRKGVDVHTDRESHRPHHRRRRRDRGEVPRPGADAPGRRAPPSHDTAHREDRQLGTGPRQGHHRPDREHLERPAR